jgi:hypothetical protein
VMSPNPMSSSRYSLILLIGLKIMIGEYIPI